jgi:hypothetical protein
VSLTIREESGHPSRHTLTRYHALDLDAAERERIALHVGECGACAAVLEALEEEKGNFQATHHRENFLARIRDEASRPGPADETPPEEQVVWWRLVFRPAPLLTGLVAVFAAVALLLTAGPDDGPTRMKGASIELGYFVSEAGKPVVAASDRVLHPGDRIQFRLTAPAGGYVHIVGVDERGTVSVYFPPPGSTPDPFPGGAGRPVPGSVILDATLGRERVFALICGTPVEPAELKKTARREEQGARSLLDTSRFPMDCVQTSLMLVKE